MEVRQKARGTTAQNDALTGPVGQITVDTDRDELRLHDGVLAGGHRILNKAQNDLLYYPAGTIAIGDVSGLQAALDAKLSLSGGTLTGALTLHDTGPGIWMRESDGDPGFNRTLIHQTGNTFQLRTYTDAGVQVSTDYRQNKGASGTTEHQWFVNNAPDMYLRANELDMNGSNIIDVNSLAFNLYDWSIDSGADAFRVKDAGSSKFWINPDGSAGLTGTLDVQGYRIYVGHPGLGDSSISFHDDNSNDERLMVWDDSQNYFVLEDNGGSYWPITMFTTTTSHSTVDFPLGHLIIASFGGGSLPNRNSSRSLHLFTSTSSQYVDSTGSGIGSQLTGTWRARGVAGGDTALWQRVA